MKIIGIRSSSFKGSDNAEISGRNIYMTYPLEKGEGLGCERVFVVDSKLNRWPYQPKVGDEVQIHYNRYGKCESMSLVSSVK